MCLFTLCSCELGHVTLLLFRVFCFQVPTMTLSGHKEGISSAQWVGTNEVYTASWDHTIKMWDIEQATEKSCIVSAHIKLISKVTMYKKT